ncbi:MAG TPA: hypothetical protein V6D47_11610 [Oscillatoriaceae cyanobacterium]
MLDPARLVDSFEEDTASAIWRLGQRRGGGGSLPGRRRQGETSEEEESPESPMIGQHDRLILQRDEAIPENPFESLLKRR